MACQNCNQLLIGILLQDVLIGVMGKATGCYPNWVKDYPTVGRSEDNINKSVECYNKR